MRETQGRAIQGRAIQAVGPRQWRRWRDLRLAALADAPEAFGSTLAQWQGAGDTQQRWRSRLSIVGALDLIAVVDADDVGMASGVPGAGGASLISMWVRPDARGTGTATALVDAVAHWAARRRDVLTLSVRPRNTAAITAYRRAGFVITDRVGDAVPGTGEHELIMSRSLRRSE